MFDNFRIISNPRGWKGDYKGQTYGSMMGGSDEVLLRNAEETYRTLIDKMKPLIITEFYIHPDNPKIKGFKGRYKGNVVGDYTTTETFNQLIERYKMLFKNVILEVPIPNEDN